MSFRRAVAWNVLVQAVGPASAFLTVLVIARLGGASDQGRYAEYKAWVDLLVALGCFGFPQGFVYVINKVGASAPALARWSRLYALAFVPLAGFATVAGIHFGWVSGSSGLRGDSVVLLTLAAGLLVLHGLWRGVYLTHDAGVSFAVFTILPALSLMLVVTVALASGWHSFEWMIMAATLPAIAVATGMMRPLLRRSSVMGEFRSQPWRPLLSNGLHSFVQAMLMALQPVIAYRMVRMLGGEADDVGFLNVGLLLVQGLSVPISMVAPLLFARWTASGDAGLMERLHGLTTRALLVGAGAGLLLAGIASALVPALFGPAYAAAVRPTQLLLLIVPLVCHARVIAPALHARGRPGINTAAAVLRILALWVGAAGLGLAMFNRVTAIAVAWVVAEAIAAAVTLVALGMVAGAEPRSAVQEGG